ncbi:MULTISPECIES: MFS transporter [Rhodanobacter]|uniref:MFS transporter n=1 Tax=Rhodanobacter TaxID=75309 RepID=UPI0004879297|nr:MULTISPECIES: MFS transporter [Rhodanobacter]UJJ55747.1 MFS transporter [Rhodanobacter thiooxydans]
MNRIRMIVALALIYMIFAILLNSVGTVILQSIATFGIDKPAASALERYKDLTIAFTSFLVASFLPMFGYRRSMMLALAIVGAACVLMPLYPSFLTTRLLFACVGVGFAMAKVCVYSSIGLLTTDRVAHSRLTNTIEGLFMLGVLGGNWLFSAFVDPLHPGNPVWVNVYWLLAGACALVIVLLASSRLDESAAHAHGHNNSFSDSLLEMLRLFVRPLVYVFLASAFLYVLIEQSFGTWLPTFNNEILKLPNTMSIQFASILAGMTALGRIGAGVVLKRVRWHVLLNACVVAMAVLVVLVLPLARGVVARSDVGWFNAPLAAYLIPLLGLLMAPIYPVINSVALSSLPKPMHAAMTGLIVVFSALGGTLGSYITARVFASFDGIHAFYFSLLPMSLILATLFLFKRETDRAGAEAPVAIRITAK